MTPAALAALAALISCSAAGADPAAPAPAVAAPSAAVAAGALPAGWKSLPAVAAAVAAAAKADGIAVDGVEAVGEPSRGCYRISLSLHAGAATAPQLATQILASFDVAPAASAVSLSELITPTDPTGELSFRFTRLPYRGRVRARLGSGRVDAIACFANQREPAACEAACTRLLQPGGVR